MTAMGSVSSSTPANMASVQRNMPPVETGYASPYPTAVTVVKPQ